jgi:hypothetical protein
MQIKIREEEHLGYVVAGAWTSRISKMDILIVASYHLELAHNEQKKLEFLNKSVQQILSSYRRSSKSNVSSSHPLAQKRLKYFHLQMSR